MAFFDINAPRRAWRPFAGFFKISHVMPRRLDQVPKHISDHLARDIGLSEHDLELLRYQMPSQIPHRRAI